MIGTEIVVITTTTIKASVASAAMSIAGSLHMLATEVSLGNLIPAVGGLTGILLIWLKVYLDHRANTEVRSTLQSQLDELREDRDYWRSLALGEPHEDTLSRHRNFPDPGLDLGLPPD